MRQNNLKPMQSNLKPTRKILQMHQQIQHHKPLIQLPVHHNTHHKRNLLHLRRKNTQMHRQIQHHKLNLLQQHQLILLQKRKNQQHKRRIQLLKHSLLRKNQKIQRPKRRILRLNLNNLLNKSQNGLKLLSLMQLEEQAPDRERIPIMLSIICYKQEKLSVEIMQHHKNLMHT